MWCGVVWYCMVWYWYEDLSLISLCSDLFLKDTLYLQGSIFWKKKNFKAKFNNTSLASFSKKTCFKILKRA